MIHNAPENVADVDSHALLSVGSKPDHGMDYGTFMATEGGRKCPQCGRYAKPETLGNLSFYTTGSVVARISMYGHLPGYGCNPSAEGNSDGIRRRENRNEGTDFMIPENTDTPLKADCPSASCSPSSDTPETDAATLRATDIEGGVEFGAVHVQVAKRLERERNEEMGYRGQWCDKARKAEAALDALEDLTRELASTKKTLGTLIVWSGIDLGSENVERLLAMMSPKNATAQTPPDSGTKNP